MENSNQEIGLLTIEEAAFFLNIKVSKLRSMVFKREVPVIKIGRLLRFCKTELSIWVSQLKRY